MKITVLCPQQRWRFTLAESATVRDLKNMVSRYPSLLSILTSAQIFRAENIPEENQKLICPSGLMYDDHLLRQYDWEIFQGLECYFVHLEVINLLPMMKSTSAAIPWGSVLPFNFTFSSTYNFLTNIPVSPLLLVGCTPFQFPLAVSRITREINQLKKDCRFSIPLAFDEKIPQHVIIQINLPHPSPYRGINIWIHAEFPHDFPQSPFALKMLTPIYHPLILSRRVQIYPTIEDSFAADEGTVCIYLYKKQKFYYPSLSWDPMMSLLEVFDAIYTQLLYPTETFKATLGKTHSNSALNMPIVVWRVNSAAEEKKAWALGKIVACREWHPNAHFVCDPTFKQQVFQLLLVLHRVMPQCPAELLHLIIAQLFRLYPAPFLL